MSDLSAYFKRQLLLTQVFGIPVRIDYRWFLVLILMSIITATSINTLAKNFTFSLVLGFGVTIVFFASIFLHELAHAAVARLEGLDVVEIILHPFGGMTRFRHEPETPRAELRIAVAGPAASFLLSVLFILIMAAANAAGTDILAILFFLLGLSNFLLAVFNMFPGYPLDGGRVLRAYLWKNGKDLNEATTLAGRCGQFIAVGLIVLGLAIVVVRGEFFIGFWSMIAGVFLYDSAKTIISEIESLRNDRVEDSMKLAIPVSPDLNLQNFIDNVLTLARQSVFPVAVERRFYGMLLLKDVKAVDKAVWRTTLIRDVMRPLTADYFVELGTPMDEAKAIMSTNHIGAVAVVDADGCIVGFLR